MADDMVPKTILGLVSEKQAAKLIGISYSHLRRSRMGKVSLRCGQIPFVNLGKRAIRYEISDLRKAIAECKTAPGAAA